MANQRFKYPELINTVHDGLRSTHQPAFNILYMVQNSDVTITLHLRGWYYQYQLSVPLRDEQELIIH